VRSFVLILLPCLALLAQDPAQKIGDLETQVQKHLQEQKPQLAIPLLREIVSLDGRNVNGQANLGVLLFFQGDYTEAMPHLRTALQIQPDLWRVQALLGIAEKRTGNSKEAQNDLERAFSNLEDPKIRIEAGLELVEIYTAGEHLEKALALSGRLQELAPQNSRIPLITYEISRQMMYHSLLSLMMVAPDSAEMHMLMGGELGRQGEHTAAIAQYREAIRLNPKLPGAHFELAEQLRTSTDAALNAQAEAEYKAALQVNPYDELSWRQLAGVLSAKGDYQTADEHYRKAIALQPRDSEAKTGLAITLISTNRSSDAIALLESALQDDPSNVAAHYRLSILYRRAGRTADAQRELESFQHYKEVKDKLGKVFKQLAGPSDQQ
jgi:tetratricopeptide (TPR) repeat protein